MCGCAARKGNTLTREIEAVFDLRGGGSHELLDIIEAVAEAFQVVNGVAEWQTRSWARRKETVKEVSDSA